MSESTQPGVELELELAAGSVTAAARAEEVDFAPTLQVAEAFRSIGLSCLRQVTRNQVPLERGDPEAVHQMRVGLRRLRAAISIFGDLLGDAETELIKAELRWLTEQLGLARDYHVFLQESVGPMKASDPDTVELESLDSALQALHANSLASAKNAVASDRCRELLDGAALWLKSGDWTRASDEPRRELRALELAHFAKGVFSARVRKTQKHLKHLADLEPARRHRLRIAIKKLHYATQFFGSVFPRHEKRKRQFLSSLKQLQDLLGQLNDLHIHQELARPLVHSPEDAKQPQLSTRAEAFALGVVIGRERAATPDLLEQSARSAKNFAKLRPFWL